MSDNPFSGAFWSSHYWSGALLTGLLLLAMASRPEIQRSPRMRRLHVSANVLAAVLLAVQAITGTRDLLEIPLSWQKPAIYACDFNAIFPALARTHGLALYPNLLKGVARNLALNQRDGIHPNAAGVLIIARGLAPVVARALKARA